MIHRVVDWTPQVLFIMCSRSAEKDVPRDAREQYVWVRKARTFEAVLAQRDVSSLMPSSRATCFFGRLYTASVVSLT